MPKKSATDRGNKIKAATRTIDILELLRDSGPMRITRMAEELDVSKSTVYNYVTTMSNSGYVISENDRYKLGLKLLSFGHSLQIRNQLYEAAKPELDELVEETNERCQVLAEENGHGVYIYQTTGNRYLQTSSRVGSRVNLHCTGIGKALLAYKPDELVEEVIESRGLEKRTENTITTPEVLYDELEKIRDEGVAFDDEEALPGLRCVAAPIKDLNDVSIGAISVSGPATRLNGSRFKQELPEAIRKTAQAIEIKYKYS
jgi:DNA-binding IclR family transcriptional regulator